MDADEVLTTTRSVRKRLDETRPVPRRVLEECAVIAAQAPTGGNNQRLRWLFVDDPNLRQGIVDIIRSDSVGRLRGLQERATAPAARRAYDSAIALMERMERIPVLAVPCMVGRRPELMSNEHAAAWYGSAIPAIWSFQLALRARGLGSVFTTVHLRQEQELARLLELPSDVTQIALLPVAYTIGTDFKPAPRKPPEEVVAFNRWSA